MVRSDVRIGLCLVVGVLLGRILGLLFVPDPTSVFAAVLTVVAAAVISFGLYRSTWLRS